MHSQVVLVAYASAAAEKPLMQEFMDWAVHAGITVNIRGGSRVESSALFVLRLECHNPAMFTQAQQWWRDRSAACDEQPSE